MKKVKVFLYLLIFVLVFSNNVLADGTTNHEAVDKWVANETYHYKKCSVSGCTERFEEEKHTGGTHDNDGLCSVCDKKYQTHNLDREKLTINEENHIYGCSYDGCEETFLSEHEESKIMAWDGKSHWYKCTNSDCDKRFEEEKHIEDEDEDGICSVCKRKYKGELEEFYIKDKEKGYIIIEDVGDKLQLELEYYPENLADDTFLWEIEDEDIATITQDGVLEAIDKGITSLTIKWNKEKITYNIYIDVEFFDIEVEGDVIFEGEKSQVKIVNEKIMSAIEWSVSDPDLASIDKKGVVTAKKGAGKEVTIIAISKNKIGLTTVKINHGEIEHTEDGGICEFCEEEVDGHELSKKYEYDEKTHWKTCENKKCKNKKFLEEKHTSSTNCKICGWEKGDDLGPEDDLPPEDEKPPIEQPDPGDGGSWVWKKNSSQHWKVNTKTGEQKDRGAHRYDKNGKCICGKVREKIVCKQHKLYKQYIGLNNGVHQHKVLCSNPDCDYSRIENCSVPECECRTFNKKELKTSLDIPIKVYYVEPDGLFSYRETEDPNKNSYEEFEYIDMEWKSENPPRFEWTMSTIPDRVFDSETDSESNDGTIIFKYVDGNFTAELNDPAKLLSEEVMIDITLIDGATKENASRDYETIKLIKNGPPRSYCQIYLGKTTISSSDKLRLKVVTKYNEFDDEFVSQARAGSKENIAKEEFPIYEVENTIKIENSNSDIIEIPNSISKNDIKLATFENDKFNGYWADIEVNPKPGKEGTANIKMKLSTVYKLPGHEPIKTERVYSTNIKVSKEGVISEESPSGGGSGTNGGANSGGSSESNRNSPSGGNSSSGGGIGLAGVGVIGLIGVAVIGAKMFGHH